MLAHPHQSLVQQYTTTSSLHMSVNNNNHSFKTEFLSCITLT